MKKYLTSILSVAVFFIVFFVSVLLAAFLLRLLIKVPLISFIAKTEFGYDALYFIMQIAPLWLAAVCLLKINEFIMKDAVASANRISGVILFVVFSLSLLVNILAKDFHFINLLQLYFAYIIFKFDN